MTRKKTNDEIKEILLNYNLKWVDKKYKNNTTPIICEDKDGYLVYVTINRLKANKIPAPFHKSNPYTIDNIKLFLSNNNTNIELISTEFIGSDSPLHCKCKICEHEWYPMWESLQQGSGCYKCSYAYRGNLCRFNIDYIKNELKIINPNIEIISNKYETAKTTLRLKCKIDGYEWNADWNRIHQGYGCPRCSYDKMYGSYNKTIANRHIEEWLKEKAIIYIINCYNNNENFYKIGITTRSTKERFCRTKEMPYNYKIVLEICTNLYDAVYLEQELHYDNKNYKYEPLIHFEGHTECFSKIHKEKIIDIKNKIENYISDINYLTNCHINIDNIVEDIRWLNKKQLIDLLIRVNMYRLSAIDLDLLDEFNISGYKVNEWITDIREKLKNYTYIK